jgi:hypothetical protein
MGGIQRVYIFTIVLNRACKATKATVRHQLLGSFQAEAPC